ncbi:MAG TPA: FISUMP domain-containing protein [bacterium]|nr:FISUMP domain-containing protein [bacterium]HPN42458.1 FISUMP domain-containing protein [bacterium]
MSRSNWFLCISVCLMVLCQNVFSQFVVQGVVRDNGSEPVANALVMLIDHADTNRVFSNTTNAQGEYSLEITGTGIINNPEQPVAGFNLLQNYPNPFNPSTVISYEIPYPAHIRIEIYNVLGQKIKTLFDGFQISLSGRVVWDTTNDQRQGVSAGVYFYVLTAEGVRVTRKMVLMDGHLGYSGLSSVDAVITYQSQMAKASSSMYRLYISGTDIITYKEDNVQITGNTTHDATVYRTDTVTDIDGNVYRTVQIGTQWWMAENLRVTHYRNGDAIPLSTINDEWAEWFYLTSGIYCYYDNDSSNAAIYGALYNGYAIIDSRQLAPEGWHIPSDEEWKQFEMQLGMSQSEADKTNAWRGTNQGGKIKESGTVHWSSPNLGATNETGFNASPGGYRDSKNGKFMQKSNNSMYWTSTNNIFYGTIWYRSLHFNSDDCYRYHISKFSGLAVRCVKD